MHGHVLGFVDLHQGLRKFTSENSDKILVFSRNVLMALIHIWLPGASQIQRCATGLVAVTAIE